MRFKDMNSDAEELLREIQLMRGLSHENIVEYLGAWVDEQECVIYIFQEWVPGGSVHQLLQKFGPFQLGVVRNYMRQILNGLQYLHNSGIIHRDIKGIDGVDFTPLLCSIINLYLQHNKHCRWKHSC